MPGQAILDYYARPAAMTAGGRHAQMLTALPGGVAELAGIVQGLALHEFVAAPFYGVQVPAGRAGETHLRAARELLDCILAADSRPLTSARRPDRRLVGVCHHFALLLLAMLRAKGIPARARWGFGTFFNPGYFEDHVLCEVWNDTQARWVLVDPQLDEVWRTKLRPDFDVMDVPRDRFLIAGDAWVQCRGGHADAAKFGIFQGDLRGLWFVAASVIRDVACLNQAEMLPWDVWGAMPGPSDPIGPDRLALFDELAALTADPDASFAELGARYSGDDRVRVPAAVTNALRGRTEPV
jgi:hypothetical protein